MSEEKTTALQMRVIMWQIAGGSNPGDRHAEQSLLELLDGGPQLIREKVDVMHAKLVEIERMLFGG